MPNDRRGFLQYAISAGLAAVLLPGLGCAGLGVARTDSKGGDRRRELRPVRDPTTGRFLLHLPDGFRYFSLGWAGEALSGGGYIPAAADGMGVISAEGSRLTLVRNQEIVDTRGAFAAADRAYDVLCGGGCIRLEVDLHAEKLVRAEVGLCGTLVNCAGGTTPWGSWLSCEEIVADVGQTRRLGKPAFHNAPRQPHGLVFEVTSSGPAQARPIPAMGRFRHEAVAVDASNGAVYLTEDREQLAGFYRFSPSVPGDLQQGGRLEMLSARGAPDLRRGLRVGQQWPVSWVEIADPMRGHTPGTLDQGGVVMQGLALGASRFLRLEGCLSRSDGIWFTSTSGGDAGGGQLWRLDPRIDMLELMFEVSDRALLDYPDNICEAPGNAEGVNAGLVICEDSEQRAHQKLKWLGRDGRLLTLAENITRIGRIDHGATEWAGCCVSPDGQWLFANIYRPGFTVAITGPWAQWLSA